MWGFAWNIFNKKEDNKMKDAISIPRVKQLHPKVIDDFKNFITDAEQGLGIVIRVTQGLRTFEEQQALYDMGRTKPGKIVTKAKPGQSYHQYGLAIDTVEIINNGKDVDWNYDMAKLVPYAHKYGITWGGSFQNFKDYPHFEKTMGYNWRDLLAKYNAKDFITGTQYVNI
jgi:LAS superfamily LD-carboxypeptidase LdcB